MIPNIYFTMSTEAALEKLAAKSQTPAQKLEEVTVQTEEQTMTEEEPSLAEDGGVADNDESTLDSKEQERRERRRAKQKERKLKEKEEKDDDTYFSASNEANKKDGAFTKALDRFVDLLNPVEKEFDDEEEDTLVSEATYSKTPTISKQPKPSIMQQLDKHVLTRFGCSSNPAYIPEDEEVENPIVSVKVKPAEGRDVPVPASDLSAFGANSILHVHDHSDHDPGDPDIQLKSLDEETSSDSSTEQPQGARAFFCGAVPLKGARPLKGEKGDDNVMSEIAEETVDADQSKGIIYSPSQLEEMPFDQQPNGVEGEAEATSAKTALGGAKAAFGNFTENVGPIIASIAQTVRTKVFLEDVGDEILSKAGDDLQMTEKTTVSDTAEPTHMEGETIFEEAVMEGHEVLANDDEPSEEGEEVPTVPQTFERDETDLPFDEEKSEDEDDADAKVEEVEVEENPKAEEEMTPQVEEARQEEKLVKEPEETPKEETKAAAPAPKEVVKPAIKSTSAKSSKSAATKQSKDKKKKTSLLGRIFKKKSKKNQTPKESILLDDEKKDVSPSEQLIIPDEPAEKEVRPAAPVDPAITNKAKRESWKNAKRQASAKKELDAAIPKSDSTEDFDLLATSSKNTANDEWDKLANPTTPARSKAPESTSSPSGVAEFSDQMAEL